VEEVPEPVLTLVVPLVEVLVLVAVLILILLLYEEASYMLLSGITPTT
tara:strand:+ start:1158 stop:1301 length:144 start_codon:yes stop_codon:yes gene_type:complete